MRHTLLKYGLEKHSKKLLHVDSAKNGLKCECVCPSCGDKLVAKNKGTKDKENHFSHYTVVENRNCLMTQLHLIAQDFFLKSKTFLIPEVSFEYKGAVLSYAALNTSVNNAELEVRLGRYFADTFLCTDHSEIAIEVCVTHENEDDKTAYYRQSKISSIEYDFSSYLNRNIDEAIKDLEANKVPYKWLYEWCREPLIQKHEKAVTQEAERIKRIRGINAGKISTSLIKNRIIELPPLIEEFKAKINGYSFQENIQFYEGGFKTLSSIIHINTTDEYVLLKGTHHSRNIWIVLLLVDYAPEEIENLAGSIIVRSTPSSSNEGFTVKKVKYDSLIEKIELKRLAFLEDCRQQVRKINTTDRAIESIKQHADFYLSAKDQLFKRDYRYWKDWMIQHQLFKSTADIRSPKIPQPLKYVRSYPILWVFDTWDILTLSHLAKIIDSYPLRKDISPEEIFDNLVNVTELHPAFLKLEQEVSRIAVNIADRRLIFREDIIKEATIPFRDAGVIDLVNGKIRRFRSSISILNLN